MANVGVIFYSGLFSVLWWVCVRARVRVFDFTIPSRLEMLQILPRLDQPDFEIEPLSNWLKCFLERLLLFKINVFAALHREAYDQFQSQFGMQAVLCCAVPCRAALRRAAPRCTVQRGWE